MFNSSIVLSDNPTDEELYNAIVQLLKSEWKYSYDYSGVSLVHMSSKPELGLSLSDNQKLQLIAVVEYCCNLMSELCNWNFKSDKFFETEIKNWDEKGLTCVYVSVLAFSLLTRLGVIPDKYLNFMQGYVKYPLRANFPSLLPFAKTQYCRHAWITINDAVLDMSAEQFRDFFHFENSYLIFGEIPDNFEYYGFSDVAVVKTYAREIAKSSGLHYYDWVDKHISNITKKV